jgi:hypothetical protein
MFQDLSDDHKNKLIELFEELFEHYQEDNWLVFKKYILRYSHPDIRKKFSTRNDKTYKHTINSFEKSFIKFCFDNYNIRLTLREEDKHYDK